MVFFWIFNPKSIAYLNNFVSLQEVDPSIQIEMRYFGDHNFVGEQITGYEASKCLLAKPAAIALKKVQEEAKRLGFSLKVYDCYRPQRAVDHFVIWAKNLNDKKMKTEFYPNELKSNLFRKGYIASKSGHSRGSTVDLTLVLIPIPKQPAFRIGQKLQDCRAPKDERYQDNSIDMGTGFDCFDPISHTLNTNITSRQHQNRLLLKRLMEKQGFENYPKEWWHYTLKDEPYPNTYFDSPVQ